MMKRSRVSLAVWIQLAWPLHNQAAPQGGQVVSGKAVIQQSSQTGQTVTTITQSSNKATLNWQTFNVGSGESVRFVQPGASAVSINRISDPNGSKILGNLSANGQVWLINPAGVYFGPGAQVNVGGLVGSTLNIADSADPYKMQGPVSAGNNIASVTNQGSIQTAEGGYVALLGANVGNTGVITSASGRILLLGDKVAGKVELSGRLDASGGQNQSTGFVETSAANVRIADRASVFTHSADGSSGNWLIDPTNFTISSGSGSSTTSSIGATTLSTSLASSSVSIATDNNSGSDSGNIYVNSAVSWTAATTLSLSAYKDIYINDAITSTSTSGKLKLLYGQGSSSGTISGVASDYYVNAPVTLGKGVNFYTQLGSTVANLKSYQVITGVGSKGSTTGTDLQGMNGSLTTNYALGADIDASGTTSWYTSASLQGFLKIGDNTTATYYSGTFAGLGHVISDLYLYRPNVGVSGLFAVLSSAAVLRDTGMVNMAITTNSSGGLVGRNYGTVKNSYTTGSITSNAGFVGGLVGDNNTTGSISNSYSTATVTASVAIPAGGLTGYNRGTITNSYASGAVSGTTNYTGGLVGQLTAIGTITGSVWDTTTSGQSSGYGSLSGGTSTGVTGLSTASMKLAANYSSWDFTTPWLIYGGYTAPLLRAFMTPLTITASASGSQTYDGTTTTTLASYTDPGTLSKNLYGSISFELDGSDVGTHSAVASGYYSDQLGYQVSYSFTTNSVSITSVTTTSSSSAYVPSSNTISAVVSSPSAVTDPTPAAPAAPETVVTDPTPATPAAPETVVTDPTPAAPAAPETVVTDPTPATPAAPETVVTDPTPATPAAPETVVTDPTPATPAAPESVVTDPTPETPAAPESVVTDPTPATPAAPESVVTDPTPETPAAPETVVTDPTPETPAAPESVVTDPTPAAPAAPETVVTDPTPATPAAPETVVTDPTPETPAAPESVVTDPTPATPAAPETVVTDPTPAASANEVTASKSSASTQTTSASAIQRPGIDVIAANSVNPASSAATTEAANTKPSGKVTISSILNIPDENNQAFTFPATDNPELVSIKKQSHLNLPSAGDSTAANTGLPSAANTSGLSHNWNAELSVDNYGSSYTGQTQTTLRQQHKQLFTNSDNLEIQFLTGLNLMKYVRLAYDRPLGDAGWNIGMSQTNLNYRLGGSAASLDAYGTAKQHSLWTGRSVFNNGRSQWLWRAQFDRNALQDIETTSDTDNDRSLQIWRLSVSASQADSAGAGRFWLNLEAGRGNVQFNNATALATDAAAANTQGNFNRYTLSSGRLQPLGSSTQLLLNWQAQWATHNLDSTQKMSMGGAHSVRAYAPGVLSGDAGHLLTAEVKHRLGPPGPAFNVSGDFYTSLFIDAGWLTLYQSPYTSDSNHARLAGAGIGLYWEGPDQWRVNLGISRRIGSVPSQLSGSSYNHDNVWVELVKGFR